MKSNLHVKHSPHRKRLPRLFLLATGMALACMTTAALPTPVYAGVKNFSKQDLKISGVVTDEKGETLPGVSVTLKGTSTGAITDINGKFTLTVPDASATLVFTYIGYTRQEVPVNGQTIINVKLEADSKSLNEVVVVGYGTQKKATLTGSISQVKGAELVKSPAPNVSNSLGWSIFRYYC
jgi:hypothetical protein